MGFNGTQLGVSMAPLTPPVPPALFCVFLCCVNTINQTRFPRLKVKANTNSIKPQIRTTIVIGCQVKRSIHVLPIHTYKNNGELRHEKLLVFSIWDFVELVFAFTFSSNYDQISSSLRCDVKKDPLSPPEIGNSKNRLEISFAYAHCIGYHLSQNPILCTKREKRNQYVTCSRTIRNISTFMHKRQ